MNSTGTSAKIIFSGIILIASFYFSQKLITPLLFSIEIAKPNVLVAQTIPPPAGGSGLISHWAFDGSAADSVGTNNGTLINGPTFTTGKIGQAISFDGIDDYVDVGNATNFGTRDFTISVWIKATQDRTDWRDIMAKWPTAGYAFQIDKGGTFCNIGTSVGGGLLFNEGSSALNVCGGAGGAVDDGIWHQVAYVRNGQARNFYIDGAIKATLNSAMIPNINSTDSDHIGRLTTGFQFFKGAMDDLRIYNRALTISEVQAIFSAGGGIPSPPPPPPPPSPTPTPPSSIPTTLGWYHIPNTKLQNVCAAVGGTSGCAAITGAWNGGVFNSTSNRLIIWGGGHNDYYGNEIYALDLNNLTMNRITNPGFPLGSSSVCQEAIANGTQPNARHTYDGIEYMPNHNRMFVFGGSLACSIGNFSSGTWTFNFQTMQWQQMNPTGTAPWGDAGVMTAYDPNTGLIFLHDRLNLYSYNFSTNQYTKLSTQQVVLGYHMAAAIDPVNKKFVIVGFDAQSGGGRVYAYDISSGSTYQPQTITTTGATALVGETYIGMDYDPVQGRMVAWDGGNNIYLLNTSAWSWTSVSYAGGPTAMINGTNGRFRYVPSLDLFVTCNSVGADCSILRLTSGGSVPPPPPIPPPPSAPPPPAPPPLPPSTSADADFAARCGALGVLVCRGFDGASEFTPAVYPGDGLYPAWNGQFLGSLDTVTKASGSGSLKFQIPPFSAANSSGQFLNTLGQNFGPGTTFYVQFRERFSPEMVNTVFSTGAGWKQAIFHTGFTSCANIELTTQNTFLRGYPQMYTDCGARGFEISLPGGEFLYQHSQGSPAAPIGYNCYRNAPNPPGNCSRYQADNWMTFYYEITVGNWGQNNSRIIASVGYDGQPLKQFTYVPNYTLLSNGGANDAYNRVTLTPYQTNKDVNQNHPTAYVWYDELIVSTQPIAAPGATGGTTPLPGDLNGDRIINSIDFSIMNSKWLTSDAASDLNKDGIVNSLDFSIMNGNWLKTY